MRRRAASVLIALPLLGCDQVERVDDDATASEVPDRVRSVLDQHCSCHAGEAQAAGGLSFDTDDFPRAFVEFGNPRESLLVEVLLPGADEPMPPSGIAMPDEDRAILIGWAQGLPFEDDAPEPTPE